MKKDSRNNKIFITLCFVIYMLVITYISFFHEAWEDESQAWLIARDLDFIEIIEQMKYEGHSFMWHYLLAIFAKSGMSYEFTNIIMLIFSSIISILILTKAPYKKITKILILFNSVFLYYMPIIIRPYILIPLMLIIISILNEKPEKYPIFYGVCIAILSNSHIIVLGLSCIIYYYYIKEELFCKYKINTKKQNIKLIIGMIFAFLGISLVLIMAVLGYICSIAATHGTDEFFSIISRAINFGKNLCNVFVGFNGNIKLVIILEIIGLLFLIIEALRINKKQSIIFIVGLLFYLYVQLTIFGIFTAQRTALIFVFILYLSWNTSLDYKEKNKINKLEILLVIICLISLPNTIKIIYEEIKYPYNDSKNVAKVIEENIEEGSIFITVNWDSISSVEVYLSGKDYKFYDATDCKFMTFATWNKFLDKKGEDYLENAINKLKDSNKKIYVLNLIANDTDIMNLNSFKKSQNKLKLSYNTKEKCLCRKAYLYEVIK